VQRRRSTLQWKANHMTSKRAQKTKSEKDASRRHQHEAGGALVGALSGAGLGAAGGPPGVVAGAVFGAVAGALTSWAVEANAIELEANEERLDAAIGVSGGDIGVPGLERPPGQRAAYSAASMGIAGSAEDSTLAEGPILPPPR
jgi:hypothetical protein